MPMTHPAPESAKVVETPLVERWKAALPNIVGGQREIVQETIDRIERLERALTELVRLKDMKDRNTFHADSDGHLSWDGWLFEVDQAEYERCQPLAWEAARAAMQAPGTKEQQQ
jgi:hypothetical protein